MTGHVTRWPISESEVDDAIERLRVLLSRAAENLQAAGRDPTQAAVLISTWCEDMAARRIWPARFRLILAELERRRLIVVDGPFAAPVDPRQHPVQMAVARA